MISTTENLINGSPLPIYCLVADPEEHTLTESANWSFSILSVPSTYVDIL
jgi:hypothetical protein